MNKYTDVCVCDSLFFRFLCVRFFVLCVNRDAMASELACYVFETPSDTKAKLVVRAMGKSTLPDVVGFLSAVVLPKAFMHLGKVNRL